jgi:hypothetical protein
LRQDFKAFGLTESAIGFEGLKAHGLPWLSIPLVSNFMVQQVGAGSIAWKVKVAAYEPIQSASDTTRGRRKLSVLILGS